jgi:hypothetical protein
MSWNSFGPGSDAPAAPVEAPASLTQRLLWALDRYRGGRGALNCPVLCEISGPLDAGRLQWALDALVARHEPLRTTFRPGRQLVQVVHSPRPVPVLNVDLSAAPDPDAAAAARLRGELASRVDPVQGPVRVTLLRTGGERHVLCVNLHHLVTDLWSSSVLFDDLALLLTTGSGEAVGLGEPGGQYRTFAAWEQERLAGGGFAGHERYWRGQLHDLALAAIPLAPATGATGPVAASMEAEIAEGVRGRLEAIARRQRTTLFAVVQSVFFALVHRLTAQTDIGVASLFAQRSRPEWQRTVGPLVNLVVLRVRLPPTPSFSDVVEATRPVVLEAFLHQELPYHGLAPAPPTAPGRRVDEIVFHMAPEVGTTTTVLGSLELRPLVPDVIGRFDVELALMPVGRRLAVKLSYNPGRLSPDGARELIGSYVALAGVVAAAPPDIPLRDLAGAAQPRVPVPLPG